MGSARLKQDKPHQRVYTNKFKMGALQILQENNFNFNKTAKQLDISNTGLRKWHAKFGKDITPAEIVERAAEPSSTEISHKHPDNYDHTPL